MYWDNQSCSNKVSNASVNFSVFTESQCSRIYNAVLEVLERTGARVFNEEALNLLRDAGCRVNKDRVWIPSKIVDKAVKSAPSRVVLADRNGKRRLFLEGRNSYFGPGPTNPNFIDLDTGERRKVKKQDVVNVSKVVDALPGLDFCMSLACISDVTPVLADVHEVQAMLENTTKPFITWAYNVTNNATIVELCETVAGSTETLKSNPFMGLYIEPATPLKHPKESLDKLLFMAKKELPVIYTPGVQGNATAPASLAGVIVMAASDCLTGLVIHQLKNEGAPFIAGGVTTNMDMRTMIHCYASSPDFCLMHAGYSELVQYLNLPMFSTAGAGDSKVLDMQAAIEYSLSIYSAALSGANLIHDVGFLESGMSGSLQGLVMGDEIISYVRKIIAGIEVNDDTLALDVIDSVGPGGHFLQEDHTYRNFKTTFWMPRLMNRENFTAWESGGSLTYDQRLTNRVKELLFEHQPEPLNDSIKVKLQAIVDKAEQG